MTADPIFEINGLTKQYPGVLANDDVSFAIGSGSIHALLGENGAGKSTLVKMIYGLVHPTAGGMRFQGADFAPQKPQDARNAGIGMVFQHFTLFDAMSVLENIAVGMENPPPMRELRAQVLDVPRRYGLSIDPDHFAGNLSAGARQRVEITRALLLQPKLFIMDEPTSVLTPQEVDILFESLRKMRDEGTSILYISHKLDEIRALCDAATIMRRGRVVASVDPRETSTAELAELMVGEALAEPQPRTGAMGDARLLVENISAPAPDHFGVALKDISLSVRAGEILGIAGVAGNGQGELLAALSGEVHATSGRITMDGNDITTTNTKSRRHIGLLTAPEERLGHAAVPQMSLEENTVLTAQDRNALSRGAWIDWRKTRKVAQKIVETFDVRTPGTHVNAAALSGGNLQKFVIGREILQAPEVLIVNQPTWGVDVSAAGFIRAQIRALAEAGSAVIVISQDLDEIYEMADSVAVLHNGELSPAHDVSAISTQMIGELMGGA